MRNRRISNLIAAMLILDFVCGYILIVRNREQKEKLILGRSVATVSSKNKQNFPVWKTIESGTYENINAIRGALISNNFKIEYWANDVLRKIPVSREKTKLDLVSVSTSQLGFNDSVPYKNIYERAQKLGLKLLPAETGPQLRLQYNDQPENEWLHIAMEPMLDSDGDPTVFDIMHYDQHTHHTDSHAHGGHSLQLCSSSVRHDVLWSPSSRWVFLQDK